MFALELGLPPFSIFSLFVYLTSDETGKRKGIMILELMSQTNNPEYNDEWLTKFGS